VIAKGPRFESLLGESFDEIRSSAKGDVGIMSGMLDAFQTLASLTAKAGLFGGAGVGKTVLETRFLTLLGFALGVSLGMWRLIAMTKYKRNDIK